MYVDRCYEVPVLMFKSKVKVWNSVPVAIHPAKGLSSPITRYFAVWYSSAALFISMYEFSDGEGKSTLLIRFKAFWQSCMSDNLHIRDLDFSLYLCLGATPRFTPLIRTWWVPVSLIQKKDSTQEFGRPSTEREWANCKSVKRTAGLCIA